MPETSTTQAADTEVVLRLDHDEHALVIAALRLMRSILGRDEADELAKVQTLLDKLGSQQQD